MVAICAAKNFGLHEESTGNFQFDMEILDDIFTQLTKVESDTLWDSLHPLVQKNVLYLCVQVEYQPNEIVILKLLEDLLFAENHALNHWELEGELAARG